MIKRYSTNFAYRQNRERGSIYGSSLGSEGPASLGAGAEPSSYPRLGGAAASLGSAHGRSWVSRMEQRQGLGTGGAFARTSTLDYASAAATASPASRYRPLSGAGPSQLAARRRVQGVTTKILTISSGCWRLDLLFGTSSMGKLTSLRNERRNAPGLSSTPEEGATARPGAASDALTDSVQSNLGQDRPPSSLSGSGLRSGTHGLRTANPMSRSQLDDLLSRMAESVGILGSKEPGPSTSGETLSDVAASEGARNSAAAAIAPAQTAGSVTAQPSQVAQPLSRPQIAATFGRGRGSSTLDAEGTTSEAPSSRLSSPSTFGLALSGEAGMRPRGALGHQVRTYGTSATVAGAFERSASDVSQESAAANVPVSAMVTPSTLTTSMDHNQLPEYEAEGDLIFKADGQQEYDPEDELPGEMEMMPEEANSAASKGVTAFGRLADTSLTAFGGGVEAALAQHYL